MPRVDADVVSLRLLLTVTAYGLLVAVLLGLGLRSDGSWRGAVSCAGWGGAGRRE